MRLLDADIQTLDCSRKDLISVGIRSPDEAYESWSLSHCSSCGTFVLPEGIKWDVKTGKGIFKLTRPKILAGVFSIFAVVGVVLGVLFSSQGPPSLQSTASLSSPKAANGAEKESASEPISVYAGTGTSTSERIQVAQYPEFKPRFISKDIFRPIYDPKFVSAEKADLEDNDFVIGLAINGDARGYPIGPLTRHEMVNDVVGGIPVLITW